MNSFVILKRDEIDKNRWNDCISKSSGSLFLTYEYIDSCEEKWEALIYIKNNEYTSVSPIQYRKRAGIKYIYQSPFIPYFEIVSADEASYQNILKELLDYLNTFNYVAKYFIRAKSLLPRNDFQLIRHIGHQIFLNQSYTAIHKSYARDRKYRLGQVKRKGHEIIGSADLNLFLDMHEKFTLPKIESIEKWQYEIIRKFYWRLYRDNLIEIIFSYDNNCALGGVIISKFGNKIYYLASVSTDEGRKFNSITLILDYIIQQNSLSQYILFDLGLEGTDGINDFKKSFGAVEYEFYQPYKNRLPWYIKIPKSILNSFRIPTSN